MPLTSIARCMNDLTADCRNRLSRLAFTTRLYYYYITEQPSTWLLSKKKLKVLFGYFDPNDFC